MLAVYERRVTHETYRQPPKSRKTPEQRAHASLLAKVDKLTVSDSDWPLPAPPKTGGGKRRR